MRLFVAVFPPPEVQSAAWAMAEPMRRQGDGVSWVKTENLHYTLRFLGELGEDGAGRVADAAREASAPRPAFGATLGDLGAFPNPRRARVIWVSLSAGAKALIELSRALEEALRRCGFDRADHPFSPHLTLGRVRVPNRDWTEPLGRAKIPNPEPSFVVDRLCVVESQLNPKGSIYRVRAEALLATG